MAPGNHYKSDLICLCNIFPTPSRHARDTTRQMDRFQAGVRMCESGCLLAFETLINVRGETLLSPCCCSMQLTHFRERRISMPGNRWFMVAFSAWTSWAVFRNLLGALSMRQALGGNCSLFGRKWWELISLCQQIFCRKCVSRIAQLIELEEGAILERTMRRHRGYISELFSNAFETSWRNHLLCYCSLRQTKRRFLTVKEPYLFKTEEKYVAVC